MLPGLANAHSHAFHRALRGRTHDDGGNFWTWRDAMYAVTHRLDPETYHALARAVFAEMLLAGYTPWGSSTTCTTPPGGRRYDDPNVMGKALLSAAREAGIRITLLDTCYLAGGLTAGGHLPLDEVQQRFCDGTRRRLGGAGGRPLRTTTRPGSARPCTRCGPCRRDDLAAVGEFAARDGRPLHVHLSEQPGENLACEGFYGCSPTELLAGEGLLGADDDGRARDPPVRQGRRAARPAARTTACFCPTTERDLADGIGPARRLHDAGVRLALGSDQQAVIDPFEELRGVEMHERLESLRARPVRRGRPARHGHALNGYRSLGWDDGGLIAKGHLADLVAVRLDSPRTAGLRARPGALRRDRRPTSRDVVVDGERVVADGRHRAGDVGRLLADAIAAVRR